MAGLYTSPQGELWAGGDCYSLSVDCNKQDSFKIRSFHCQSGEAFEGDPVNCIVHFPNSLPDSVAEHHCLGSWREGSDLFIYTRTDNPSDQGRDHACFVSTWCAVHNYSGLSLRWLESTAKMSS